MTLLVDAIFSSVALGHLMVDVINGQRSVLLAYLSGKLGLTNATIGLISTIYVMSASLLQPFFGYVADRLSPKWVIVGGVLWMAIFYTLALTTPGNLAMVWLIIASIGSGAYHPAATVQATMRGNTKFAGHEASAAAYFFVFGQLGYLFGPILAGPILDQHGQEGLLIFAFSAAVVGLFLVIRLKPQDILNSVPVQTDSLSSASSNGIHLLSRNERAQKTSMFTRNWSVVLPPLIVVAAMQSWVQQNVITFIPKYLNDLGQSASFYGLIAALFMAGSAIGNILGGNLADRFGKRKVVLVSLILAIIPLYMLPRVGISAWLYLLIPLAGALTGSVYSILVVIAQRIIPGGMALASGLILGFMFSAGALGTFISGYFADAWGMNIVLELNAVIVFIASLGAFKLASD